MLRSCEYRCGITSLPVGLVWPSSAQPSPPLLLEDVHGEAEPNHVFLSADADYAVNCLAINYCSCKSHRAESFKLVIVLQKGHGLGLG